MPDGCRILGLIPARGGSKRLPGKNLRPLAGQPLLEWTVAAALAARCLDRVVVSSDDEGIAATARALGAEAPFLRPAALAGDAARTVEAARHALEFYRERGETFDYLMLLQPTSPLRSARQIDEAASLALARRAAAVISVCPVDHPPAWSNPLPADRSMDRFLPSARDGRRSQEQPSYHRLNGAIYLITPAALAEADGFFPGHDSYAYEMDRRSSIDIDDELDFEIAECLMRREMGVSG